MTPTAPNPDATKSGDSKSAFATAPLIGPPPRCFYGCPMTWNHATNHWECEGHEAGYPRSKKLHEDEALLALFSHVHELAEELSELARLTREVYELRRQVADLASANALAVATITRVSKDAARRLDLLRYVEWAATTPNGQRKCPRCDGFKLTGHEPDCELKKEIE